VSHAKIENALEMDRIQRGCGVKSMPGCTLTDAFLGSGVVRNRAVRRGTRLVAEGKCLSVQRCSRSESLSNRRERREDDREHRVGKPYPTPFKFNWFNENGVFGRDNDMSMTRKTSCSENFGHAVAQDSRVTLWPRRSRRLT